MQGWPIARGIQMRRLAVFFRGGTCFLERVAHSSVIPRTEAVRLCVVAWPLIREQARSRVQVAREVRKRS